MLVVEVRHDSGGFPKPIVNVASGYQRQHPVQRGQQHLCDVIAAVQAQRRVPDDVAGFAHQREKGNPRRPAHHHVRDVLARVVRGPAVHRFSFSVSGNFFLS